MEGIPVAIWIILGIISIIAIWFITVCNKFTRAKIKIEEASSGIDVALTKRYDTLTKMVDVCKSYMKHEKETLLETIKFRKDMTTEEKVEANEKMNAGYEKILAVAESYPELKSSENFAVLQKSIADVEEHLQASRRLYNSTVARYNEMIQVVPTNIVAKIRGLKSEGFFEASNEAKKDVKMDIK